MTDYYCPCGAKLLTRESLAKEGDHRTLRDLEPYIGADDGYCPEEDEVVPLEWVRAYDPDLSVPSERDP